MRKHRKGNNNKKKVFFCISTTTTTATQENKFTCRVHVHSELHFIIFAPDFWLASLGSGAVIVTNQEGNNLPSPRSDVNVLEFASQSSNARKKKIGQNWNILILRGCRSPPYPIACSPLQFLCCLCCFFFGSGNFCADLGVFFSRALSRDGVHRTFSFRLSQKRRDFFLAQAPSAHFSFSLSFRQLLMTERPHFFFVCIRIKAHRQLTWRWFLSHECFHVYWNVLTLGFVYKKKRRNHLVSIFTARREWGGGGGEEGRSVSLTPDTLDGSGNKI